MVDFGAVNDNKGEEVKEGNTIEGYRIVATFVLPSELAVAKSKLESEGIQCRVLDEFTIQSHNFLSNAMGGVKLQVLQSDFEHAYSILKVGGFIKESAPSTSIVQRKLENPIVQKRLKYALISFVIISIVLVIVGISNSSRPIISERLVSDKWCLKSIILGDLEYTPYTLITDSKPHFTWGCNEFLKFEANGQIELPGFDSRVINGKWEVINDQVVLSQMDTLNNIFEGTFTYEVYPNSLFLYSDHLEFICHKVTSVF